MTEHLGYERHDPAGHHSGNSRNGTRTTTLLTEVGPVTVEVPRDRAGTFAPVIVPKGGRRLNGIDNLVLWLTARGLTTGEIAAHVAEVYGASVSKDTIWLDQRLRAGTDGRMAPPAAGPGLPGAVRRRHRAPRGAVLPSGGERPAPPGRRSGWVKLRAA